MLHRLRRLLAKKTRQSLTRLSIEPLEDRAVPAAFTPGDLVVYRVGDGSASLSGSATAVFLDEYSPNGTKVQTISLPTSGSGSNHALTSSGSAVSEGFLTLSADGRYILLTGYDAAVGTASVASTTSAAVNRVVGRVDANGNVDTTTALTNFTSGNNVRGATSNDGTNIWVTGASTGLAYTTLGSTSATQTSTTVTSDRAVEIFNGQLYISTSSGSTVRLGSVGSNTPITSGQTITNLSGLSASTGSPYAFFFADLSSSVAGVDTLYVADDGASGGSNVGIQKYTLTTSGGAWTANGSPISASSVRGLTGVVNGTSVTLYLTNGSTLATVTDSSGYAGTPTASVTTIASAAANTAFRGVAFVPTGTGVIGDRVFIDSNSDGVFNGSDSGVSGVKVNLYADTNTNGSYDSGTDQKIATTTTDSNGKYSFTNLLNGTYFVEADISGVSPLTGYGLSGGAQPRKVTIQATPTGRPASSTSTRETSPPVSAWAN